MKKLISFMVMIVFVVIALTGCVTINYELTINKNGSGEISYVYAFEKEMLESMGTTSEDMVADMREQAEESGYEVEVYKDDTLEGFKATKKLKDVSKEFSLEEAFGADYIKDTEDNKIKVEKGLFGTKYSQKAEIDLTSLEDMSLYGMTIKYVINLPTKAGTHNADKESKDGKTLTWDLMAGQVTEIEFKAETNNMIIFAVVGVLGLAVIIVVVLVVAKSSKKEKVASAYEPEEVVEPKTVEPEIEEVEAIEAEEVAEPEDADKSEE